MFSINSNLTSLKAQTNLTKAKKNHAEAMKRLSSGLRINGAKDDAAGLAICDRIETEVKSQYQVRRNIQDGLSYAQVGDAALNEIQNLLQRGHELAVQAANGTLSDTDRQSLNAEFSQIKEQITDIALNTQIFGKRPLQSEPGPPSIKDIFGASGNTVAPISGVVPMSRIPAGAINVQLTIDALGMDDDIQIFTADGKHLVGTDLTDAMWQTWGLGTAAAVENTVFTKANGFAAGATYDATLLNSGGPVFQDPPNHTSSYNGMSLTFSGDGDRTGATDPVHNDGFVAGVNRIETFRVDKVTENLIVSVVGTGAFTATATWDFMPDAISAGPVKILVETTPKGDQSYIVLDKTPADAASLGVAGSALDPAELARQALDELKGAMSKVSDFRGYYGAKMNALEERHTLVQQGIVVNSETMSRIMDADLARESASLTRSSILQNASASLLAQANLQPNLALELIK